MRPVRVFAASRGNEFMTDIARWVVEAAAQTGRSSELVLDRLPAEDGSINLVMAPHEFYVLSDADNAAIRRAGAASVAICTEQPGTPWFHMGLQFLRYSALALDINQHGVEALRANGVPAERLTLGGVPSMNQQQPGARRSTDLLFMGGDTGRRAAKLAALAPILWDRRCDLRTFRFTKPVHSGVPGLVFGADKYRVLADSRLLLNLHRDDVTPGYFEWARMVEAMANGCVVLTERSTGHEPLVAGKHFVESTDIATSLTELLDEERRCAEISAAASAAVLDEHPLVNWLAPLLEQIEDLPAPRPPRRIQPFVREHKPPLLPAFQPAAALRQRVYRAVLAEIALQRDIERARSQLLYGTDDHVVETTTAAYAAAAPEVSVVVTLFNYAGVVTETLDSIVASEDVVFELIVVDDHSTDEGRAVVETFMAEHPDVPVLLLGSDINRGLVGARNLGFGRARADRVMVIDADNLVYPNCLRRLSDALDRDPGAAFAYSTLEDFGVQPGLRSAMDWYVPWLCEMNYIDAQAMICVEAFNRVGGYQEHADHYGWEDWDLWLRMAAAGERGVHVRSMLGRYRTQTSSIVTITNLAEGEMRAALRRAYPTLPWS